MLFGSRADGSCLYQASAPSSLKSSTMLLLMELSLRGSPHLSQRKTAMGTPQMRWREMHQSGRVAIMLEMRSSPQAGVPDDLLDFVEGALAEGGACRCLRCFGRNTEILSFAQNDGA